MSTEDILKYISNFTQETPVPSPSPTPSDTSSEATGRKRSLSTDGYEEEPALKVPKLELQVSYFPRNYGSLRGPHHSLEQFRKTLELRPGKRCVPELQ